MDSHLTPLNRWMRWKREVETKFDTFFGMVFAPLIALAIGQEIDAGFKTHATRPSRVVRRFILLTYPITGLLLCGLLVIWSVVWFVSAICLLTLFGIGNVIVRMWF